MLHLLLKCFSALPLWAEPGVFFLLTLNGAALGGALDFICQTLGMGSLSLCVGSEELEGTQPPGWGLSDCYKYI